MVAVLVAVAMAMASVVVVTVAVAVVAVNRRRIGVLDIMVLAITLCIRGPNYWVLKGPRALTIRSLEAQGKYYYCNESRIFWARFPHTFKGLQAMMLRARAMVARCRVEGSRR